MQPIEADIFRRCWDNVVQNTSYGLPLELKRHLSMGLIKLQWNHDHPLTDEQFKHLIKGNRYFIDGELQNSLKAAFINHGVLVVSNSKILASDSKYFTDKTEETFQTFWSTLQQVNCQFQLACEVNQYEKAIRQAFGFPNSKRDRVETLLRETTLLKFLSSEQLTAYFPAAMTETWDIVKDLKTTDERLEKIIQMWIGYRGIYAIGLSDYATVVVKFETDILSKM